MARRIVERLALTPGERVLSVAHPGTFAELMPHVRYAVMQAGAIDLGVIDVLQEPVPPHVRPRRVAERRTRRALALQGDVSRYRCSDHDARRQHITPRVPGNAGLAPGRPEGAPRPAHDSLSLGRGEQRVRRGRPAAPPRVAIDAVYQRALLETDYRALAATQRQFAAALKGADVRITSPVGTDLRFRTGDRPVNFQDGDALSRHAPAPGSF